MSNYHLKYMKYKEKYLKEKSKQRVQTGGFPNVLLNNVNYIDTLKLNDGIIYKDNNDLYVIDLSPDMIMWRAYNNLTCSKLHVPPGSIMDSYRYSPAWYGPPEAIIVYCAMNINRETMMRTYSYYNEFKNMIMYNVDDYIKRNEHLMKNNLSSLVAYSINNPCKLIDINNIHNIKKLITEFRKNFTRDNYKKLYDLNRITSRQLNIIGSWSRAIMENRINYGNYKNEINEKYNIDQIIKTKDLFNLMGIIIEWSFRYAIGYGMYMYMYKEKMVTRKIFTDINTISIDKYVIDDYDNPYINYYNNINNINNLRSIDHNYLNINDTDKQKIINKQKEANDKFTEVNNKAREYVKNEIDKFIQNENNNIERKKTELVKEFLKQQKTSEDMINDILNGKETGYVIDLLNGSKIGFLYLKDNNYRVYFNYKFNNKKIHMSETCPFCNLNKTRNWFDSKYKDSLSHMYGLSANHVYYSYHPGSNQVEPLGMAFTQTLGKDIPSVHEEKLLSIPFNHVPTKGDHPDCKIGSKTFPPNGVYQLACGALLYQNNLDDEVVFNFMNTYYTAHSYAYAKTKKIFKDADINYDVHNGKYYKFKDPIANANEDPRIYLIFHTKTNSIQHLHLHTYIDEKGSGLHDLFESTRINIEGVDDINNDLLQDGGDNVKEIFGSSEYGKYEYQKSQQKKKYIKFTGNRIINEKTPYEKIKWVNPRGWIDIFGFRSSNYDEKYKCVSAVSFEYMFKRLLGIGDEDERMKQHYIFPDPLYHLQEGIFDQTANITYPKKYAEFLEDIYNDNKMPLLTTNVNGNDIFNEEIYSTMHNKQNMGIKNTKYKDYKKSVINTTYANVIDETGITRQSVTDIDTVMTLLLQFACINSPEIGGYYGHIGPVLNSWKNITHTEICLFNLVDYPVKAVVNADYSTCNITDPNIIAKDKNISYVVLSLYILYFTQHQQTLIRKNNRFVNRNIFKDFLGSEIQMGGRAELADKLINDQFINNKFINNKLIDNKLIDNKLEPISNNIKNDILEPNKESYEQIELTPEVVRKIINKYNTSTKLYKIDENDNLAHNIIWTTLYPFILTGGNELPNEIKSIDNLY